MLRFLRETLIERMSTRLSLGIRPNCDTYIQFGAFSS